MFPRRQQSPSRPERYVIAVAVLCTVMLGALRVRAAFTEPGSGVLPTEYPGAFDLPLNSSSIAQTKTGSLTVNGIVTANGGLCIGQKNGVCDTAQVSASQICWNGTDPAHCRSSWTSASVASFVHLQPPETGTDTGYARIDGLPAATASFAAQARAGTWDGGGTTYPIGVYGQSSSQTAGFSAGVVGDAGSGLPEHYGIFAWVGSFPSAVAGYFNGNVRIIPPADLVVGPIGSNVAIARTDNIAEVCLGDAAGKAFNEVCKSAWDLGGSSEWSLNGNVLWPGLNTKNVSWANGLFQIAPYSNGTADMSVQGNTTFTGTMVVGTPCTPGAAGCSFTPTDLCGDGICSAGENATSCVLDCDRTPPGNVGSLNAAVNDVAKTVLFTWSLPPDADVAGTHVVQTTVVPPIGPQQPGTNILKASCSPSSCQWQTGTLTEHVQYYFGFYTYDAPVGNYASGVIMPIQLGRGGGGGDGGKVD